MPIGQLRGFASLVLLVAMTTASIQGQRIFVGVSTFSVRVVRIGAAGSGTVETNYVNPGDPIVHITTLHISGVAPTSIAVVKRNGLPCGKLAVHFYRNGQVLGLGTGANTHFFSASTEGGIQPYIADLQRTAAIQQRRSHPTTVVSDLVDGC